MIGSLEKRIVAQHRSNEASKRLETIPGIGVIGATTIAATPFRPKFRRVVPFDFCSGTLWIVFTFELSVGRRHIIIAFA
jgi:hypothetical protein